MKHFTKILTLCIGISCSQASQLENPIHLIYTTNDGYAEPTRISMTSAMYSTGRPIHFHISAYNLSKDSIQALQDLSKEGRYAVDIQPMSEDDYQRLETLKTNERWSPLVYNKFFYANIFPNVEKAACLDCDTLVNYNIAKLFDIPLGDHYWAAVNLGFLHNIKNFSQEISSLHLSPSKEKKKVEKCVTAESVAKSHGQSILFDGGVMLNNLSAIRRDNIVAELLEEHNTKKTNNRQFAEFKSNDCHRNSTTQRPTSLKSDISRSIR